MSSLFRGLLVAVLSGLCGWLNEPVHAQDARPRSTYGAVQALDAVATQVMSPVDNAALQARHPLSLGGGPLRFAEPLPASITPVQQGTWEQLADGTWLWRLRVRSADAASLSLGFTRYRMPAGGTLFLYAPDRSTVRGPFTAEDNKEHGELWTPLLPADEVVVEVSLPADRRDELVLEIGQVNHGFRSIAPRSMAKRSGACNVDVACSEAEPWRRQSRAVGRYTLSNGVLCTGALVNNTTGDQTPYFLTANHCGITEENAASVVVYWNFENSFCRSTDEDGGRGNGPLNQFSSGATLRARTGDAQPQYDPLIRGSDFTLIELDTPLDVAFNAYFAGWNRTDAPTSSQAVSIHHPRGEEKRISFDLDPTTITSYLEPSTTLAPTHLRVGNWEIGTTEAGSSGSPLFDADQRIVGILSGGFAGCALGAEDNDQPDWYGRLAYAWDSGATPSTRLRDWLDPAGTDAMTLDGIDLENDTTPPGPITNFSVTEVGANGITLQWQATGDDGFQGTAARYELRYATAPIRSQAAFDAARVAPNLPPPQPSGSEERFTVQGLRDNTPYYFALIARDNVNNESPLTVTSSNVVVLNAPVVVQPGYPNPFRTTTTIGIAVDETQHVRVDVYDALGRRIQHVYDAEIPANTLRTFRVGRNSMASGAYFVRIVGDAFQRTTQVVRAR
jgi:lysyl endopeptidase